MKHIIQFLPALVALVLASCGEWDNDWQAGPEAKEGCQQVRFAAGNDLNAILFPGETAVTLTLERSTDAAELTVPITTISATEGLTIPATATFAAGSKTTEIQLAVPATAAAGTAFSYSLAIESDEVDPYADTECGPTLTGNIFFPTLRHAKAWVSGYEDIVGTWGMDIYDLGSGKYMVRDMMGSGIDVMMTADANNELSFSSPQWTLSNIDPDVDYAECTYYYFYDYAGDFWNTFYPHGQEAWVNITQFGFYSGDGYAAYYPESDSFQIYLPYMSVNTGAKGSGWPYLNIQFLKDGEEFTPYLPDEPAPPTPPSGDKVTFTAWFDKYYDFFGGTWQIEATRTAENTYLFEDFMYSGESIEMTLDPATGAIALASPTNSYSWEGSFYIVDSSGNYATCWPNYQAGVQENYASGFLFYEGNDYTYYDPTTQSLYLYTYMNINDDWDNQYGDYLCLTLDGAASARKATATPSLSRPHAPQLRSPRPANGKHLGAAGGTMTGSAGLRPATVSRHTPTLRSPRLDSGEHMTR